MKTVKTLAFRSLIVFATFLALGLSAYHTSAKAATEDEKTRYTYCGVTEPDIIKYLDERGYQVLSIRLIDGCCDRLAGTTSCDVRVFISEGRIVGHEDVHL